MLKIIGFVIVLFGLLTAIYGVAVVVPKYADANSAWMTAPNSSPRRSELEERRYELRTRSQSYAMTAVGTAVVGVALAIAGRKKAPGLKLGFVIGAGVLSIVLMIAMQATGNIF